MRFITFSLLIAYGSPSAFALAGIMFTPGHFYTSHSNYRKIYEADEEGRVLGFVELPSSIAQSVRGLAFGPDGLLYATVEHNYRFTVLALDHLGNVRSSYPTNIYPTNHLPDGKLAIGGNYIYVTGDDQAVKIKLGDPTSASVIYTNYDVTDVEILPSGNLLVASSRNIEEITPDGELVRSIELSPTTRRLPDGTYSSYRIVDVEAIEYDPVANDIYFWQHGYTNFFRQLVRIDATSGRIKDHREVGGVYDLHIAENGELLMGSTKNSLGGFPQLFITQLSRVPEPSSAAILICGGLMMASTCRRSFGRFHTSGSQC